MKKKRKTKRKITMKSCYKTKARKRRVKLAEIIDKAFGAKGFTDELIKSGRLIIST